MLSVNGGGGKHYEQTIPMTEFILISSIFVYLVFSLTQSSASDKLSIQIAAIATLARSAQALQREPRARFSSWDQVRWRSSV